MSETFLDSPLHVDGRGRAAVTTPGDHVRDLIRAVLFTIPGERVNRPGFGCALRSLVFAPNSDALAGATQLMIRAALQRWLEEKIAVERVEVTAEESSLAVLISYTRLDTGSLHIDEFSTTASGIST